MSHPSSHSFEALPKARRHTNQGHLTPVERELFFVEFYCAAGAEFSQLLPSVAEILQMRAKLSSVIVDG